MGEIRETGVPTWRSTPARRLVELQVLTETGCWPVLVKERRGDRSPFMTGIGERGVDLVCGGCGHLLAERIDPADKLSGLVFACPACDAHNLA